MSKNAKRGPKPIYCGFARVSADGDATLDLTLKTHCEDSFCLKTTHGDDALADDALDPDDLKTLTTHCGDTLPDDRLDTDDAKTLTTHCDDTLPDDTLDADDAKTLTTHCGDTFHCQPWGYGHSRCFGKILSGARARGSSMSENVSCARGDPENLLLCFRPQTAAGLARVVTGAGLGKGLRRDVVSMLASKGQTLSLCGAPLVCPGKVLPVGLDGFKRRCFVYVSFSAKRALPLAGRASHGLVSPYMHP
eukprot:Skav204932  [mRNA]  locus=scaffold2514:43239:43985:- [translate_table: standard]